MSLQSRAGAKSGAGVQVEVHSPRGASAARARRSSTVYETLMAMSVGMRSQAC